MQSVSEQVSEVKVASLGAIDVRVGGRMGVALGPIELPLVAVSLGLVAALSCGAVIASVARGEPLDAAFEEWSLITYVSAGLLTAIAGMLAAMAIVRVRRVPAAERLRSLVWVMLAGGFAFLAVDELFSLHERFDLWIHQALQLRETPLSDRIDDAIIGGYGLAGLWIMSRYFGELKRLRDVWPVLRLAFVLLFAMVAMDLLTNSWVSGEEALPDAARDVEALAAVGLIVEETLKLSSEAMFLLGFLALVAIGRRREAAVG